jgi:thiol:disulfide interchange protein DsbD
MKKASTSLLLLLLTFLPQQTSAQGESESVVKVRGFVSTDAVRRGDKFKVAVALEIASGYHINANIPSFEGGIGTKAQLTSPLGIALSDAKYPPSDQKTFAFAQGQILDVYEGLVPILFDAEAASTIRDGIVVIESISTVQACDDTSCLGPSKISVSIPVKVVAVGTPVQPLNPEIFSGLRQFQSGSQDDLGRLIASSGLPLALLTVFLAGLALNLTPCVYPIIPITIGFFVNQASGKRQFGRTSLMAATYVFGMAITYSLLGVVASMTGGLFGAALQSPIVLFGLAGVMVALSLSMFGLYEFRVPASLNRFASQSSQSASGVIGALVMGLTMGIVAAPCIGPFVVGLLVHVSAKGDPLYGFVIFFVLALGLGLPYVFLGTFSGTIKDLPRSGEWMVAVRKVFGLVLLGMALYFLMPLMGVYTRFIFMAYFAVAALYLMLWESGRTRSRPFAWVLRAIGAGAVAAAVYMAMPEKPGIPWQPYSEQSLAAAQKEGRPVVIDVFADWCIPCKELDKRTFTDDDVKSEATRFVALKLNLTIRDSEADRAYKKFNIKGVPTVIFLDSSGLEDESLRLTTFEKPKPFLERMKRIPPSPVASARDTGD